VLQRSGYRAWTVFDNYGDVVLRTREIEALFQLFDYVDRQNAGLTTRTIHYFDVLASTERHEALLRNYGGLRLMVLEHEGFRPTGAAFQKDDSSFEIAFTSRTSAHAGSAHNEFPRLTAAS
jgi:hypothetical protein